MHAHRVDRQREHGGRWPQTDRQRTTASAPHTEHHSQRSTACVTAHVVCQPMNQGERATTTVRERGGREGRRGGVGVGAGRETPAVLPTA